MRNCAARGFQQRSIVGRLFEEAAADGPRDSRREIPFLRSRSAFDVARTSFLSRFLQVLRKQWRAKETVVYVNRKTTPISSLECRMLYVFGPCRADRAAQR